MISRVADHCFWFGRYLERAESAARVLAVTQHLALDAEIPPPQCWLPVLIAFGQRPQFVERHGEAAAGDGEAVQRSMSFDEGNAASLRRSIAGARDNARSIREVVSLEVWETVNELHLWMCGEEASEAYALNRYGFYRRIRQLVQLALGLTQSTMLADTPLDFIWLGVLLERIDQTARTLDVHHLTFSIAGRDSALAGPSNDPSSLPRAIPALTAGQQVVETALWLSLLRACSGFEPFMKLSQGRVTGEAVARFLLFEPRFPRSIRHCAHAAYVRLCDIRPPESATLPGGATLQRLHALYQGVTDKALEGFEPARLHELLTYVVDETAAICDGIGQELLGHGPPRSTPPQPQP
jgi:uncharacterized alpha-E superfamily protein